MSFDDSESELENAKKDVFASKRNHTRHVSNITTKVDENTEVGFDLPNTSKQQQIKIPKEEIKVAKIIEPTNVGTAAESQKLAPIQQKNDNKVVEPVGEENKGTSHKGLWIGAVVVMFLILFIFVGGSSSKPEDVVKSYYVSLTKKDYAKAYDLTYLSATGVKKENQLLTKDNFKKSASWCYDNNIGVFKKIQGNISDFQAKEKSKNDKEIIYDIAFKITNGSQKTTHKSTVRLIKENGKFLLDPGFIVNKGFSVNVPMGSSLSINGTKFVSSGFILNSETKIPALFVGEYEVSIEHDILNTISKKITVGESNVSKVLNSDDLQIKNNKQNLVPSIVGDFYRALFKAALEGKTLEQEGFSSFVISSTSIKERLAKATVNAKKGFGEYVINNVKINNMRFEGLTLNVDYTIDAQMMLKGKKQDVYLQSNMELGLTKNNFSVLNANGYKVRKKQ